MNRRHRGRRARKLTTAAGDVRLSRVYFECPQCLDGGHPLDERLGVDGRYSWQAQRLICLAGASWSYDMSSERLGEFCGLKVSDTTVREMSQYHGAKPTNGCEPCRTPPVSFSVLMACAASRDAGANSQLNLVAGTEHFVRPTVMSSSRPTAPA